MKISPHAPLLKNQKGNVQHFHALNIDLEAVSEKDGHGNTTTPCLEDSKEQGRRIFCGKVISSQQKLPETEKV